MITQKEIKKIKALGIHIDHQMAFGGKSKGNRHLVRVVALAKYLALQAGGDIKIVEAGAWLHDTALPSGNDYSYKQNKKIVKELLESFDFSKSEKDKIIECVASHEGTTGPKTLEAQIVHDADVLEKTGVLGIIRHTWKLTNKHNLTEKDIDKKFIKELVDHIKWRGKKIITKAAKKMHKVVASIPSQKTLVKIVPIISKLASESVITEKIAKQISKYLSRKENAMLEKQLGKLG
jgi:HD superfamily phosphodiesterase